MYVNRSATYGSSRFVCVSLFRDYVFRVLTKLGLCPLATAQVPVELHRFHIILKAALLMNVSGHFSSTSLLWK